LIADKFYNYIKALQEENKYFLFVSLLDLMWLPEWDDFRTFRVDILETVKNWPKHLAV
jgi:hypothetical protein